MRGLRIVLFFVLLVVVVGGGGMLGFWAMRGKTSDAFEVKPGLHGVKSTGGIYLYAARAGDSALLFDTGADAQARPVDVLLVGMGMSRSSVDTGGIFLTHAHFDHIQGAVPFSSAKIYLGLGDVGLAAGTTPPEAVATRLLTLVMHGAPVKATDLLSAVQVITVGGGKTVKAIPIPGHTPGSFAYLYDGVLFVGDTMVFKEGRLDTTPAIFDARPEENRAAIRSLKTQLVADSVDMVCTGHGGCTAKGLGRNLLDDLISRVGG